MTGPDEPWDLPELQSPTSVSVPEPEPEPTYDTGSDGWWRAQAKAQREAADHDPEPPLFRPMPSPVMPPIELVEPTVLNDPAFLPSGPSPLDAAYLPVEEVFPPLAQPAYGEPVFIREPVIEEPAVRRPVTVPEPIGEWAPAEVEPRRISVGRAVAWAGLALAGVGLVVAALLLLGKGEPKGTPIVALPPQAASTTQATASPTPSVAPTPQPSLSIVAPAPAVALAPIVALTVLNNSRIHHLAQKAATKFRAGGWPVSATGNYGGQIATTTIYYPPGQQGSAERFAKQFGVRVLPRFATLPGHGMTVVVTRDFA